MKVKQTSNFIFNRIYTEIEFNLPKNYAFIMKTMSLVAFYAYL